MVQDQILEAKQMMWLFLLASLFGLFMLAGESILDSILSQRSIVNQSLFFLQTGTVMFYASFALSFMFIVIGIWGFWHYRRKAADLETALGQWR